MQFKSPHGNDFSPFVLTNVTTSCILLSGKCHCLYRAFGCSGQLSWQAQNYAMSQKYWGMGQHLRTTLRTAVNMQLRKKWHIKNGTHMN